MKKSTWMMERAGGIIIGGAFMIIALSFLALGFTFLPAIGVLIAIPLLTLSIYFLRADRRLIGREDEAGGGGQMAGSWCPWFGHRCDTARCTWPPSDKEAA